MKGSAEKDEDEVEGDSSQTSLSNNSEEDNETTETEYHKVTEEEQVTYSKYHIN
jgi:hypothetical protein